MTFSLTYHPQVVTVDPVIVRFPMRTTIHLQCTSLAL